VPAATAVLHVCLRLPRIQDAACVAAACVAAAAAVAAAATVVAASGVPKIPFSFPVARVTLVSVAQADAICHLLLLSLVPSLLLRLRNRLVLLLQPTIGMLADALVVMVRGAAVTPHLSAWPCMGRRCLTIRWSLHKVGLAH